MIAAVTWAFIHGVGVIAAQVIRLDGRPLVHGVTAILLRLRVAFLYHFREAIATGLVGSFFTAIFFAGAAFLATLLADAASTTPAALPKPTWRAVKPNSAACSSMGA